MLDPATARLCVWRLPLEAAFRLFSKLGSLGGSIRERFSRTGRTRPALARPAFSRWLLENDRLRERWPCQWLNVLYFPFSETSPISTSRPGALPSPIPPAPSRWEGERVALCRQACRPRGASLASPAPCRGSVGTFQGRQGFASPSGVARVLAFGCGPLQPPLRPLTPFPLENPKPRRTESRHAAVPVH